MVIKNWKIGLITDTSPILLPVKCIRCGRPIGGVEITVPYNSVVGTIECGNC